MPIYEYSCDSCGHDLEVIQRITDSPLQDCPNCKEPTLRKLVSAAGFRLKGSGWYATDFKGGAKPKTESTEAETKPKTEKKTEGSKHSCGGGSCACAS